MSTVKQLAKEQRARVLGTEWAFFGQATKWIAPKKGWTGREHPADKSAHAYYVVEDAIFAVVTHLSEPRRVEYWSARIRGVLISKYRDGTHLSTAERLWLCMVMKEALKLDRERSAIFEAA